MIKFLKKTIRAIWREISSLPILVYAIICSVLKSRIIVQAWCKYKSFALFREDPIVHNNWGDDINYYFMQQVIGKKVIIYPNSKIAQLIAVKRYSLIGSVLTGFNLNNVVVCGSGILNGERTKVKGTPKTIKSVRGPLTRNRLIANGYECPECYGDPALLLPLYYKPNVEKKYKISIIPHYIDFDTELIKQIQNNNYSDIHIIKMRGYKKWEDVIDDIYSSEIVLSSSLHGLIVSEAYKIPCVWIQLSDYVKGWDFKFNDFYESIGKVDCKPVQIRNIEDVYASYHKKGTWEAGQIDYDYMLETLKNTIIT